ncbi:MAG: hypothetical protein F6K52_11065 [Moorea sp. SIO3H5]|nr:hypothetical protein [Moorena sp. SIO3H5]
MHGALKVRMQVTHIFSLLPTPDSRFPTPYSLFPVPDSRFPVPYSLLPTPYSLFPYDSLNAQKTDQ